MELPRLRLRKVFEHGTHFKVQKPSGQTITIAKKGLSPGTIKRYQRLAHGGEVRNYQVGGEVPGDKTPEQQDEEMQAYSRMIDATNTPEPEPAPAEPAEPDVATRRPFTGTEGRQTTMMEEFEALPPPPAQPRRLDARRAVLEAKEAREELPGNQPDTPPPVVVNVNTPPAQPAAPVAPAPTASPAPVAPSAPAATEAAPVAAPPPTQKPLPPVVAPVAPPAIAPKSLSKLSAPQPVQTLAEPLDLTPGATPDLGVAPSPEPIDVERALVGMQPAAVTPVAAAPTAPVAPPVAAPVAVPTPVVPIAPTSTQLTVESLRSAMKASPDKTVAQIVNEIAPASAPAVVATQPEIFQLKASDLAKPGAIVDLLLGGISDSINAAQDLGEAEKAAARIEFDALEQQRLAIAERAAKSIQRKQEIEKHLQETRADAEASDDLRSFIGGSGSSQGLGYSIFSIAALAIGGALSGYTQTPNYVLTAFNQAMERDLEEQKRRRNSRWQKYKDALGDDQSADQMLKAYDEELLSVALKQSAIKAGAQKIQPKIDDLIARLKANAAERIAMIDYRLAQAEDEREVAPPRVGRVSSKKDEIDLSRDRYETGRTIGVGQIPVQTNTATGTATTNRNLANRNFAVQSLTKAVHLLETMTPEQIANFTKDKRADAIASLAYVVENFPQAFGYERAVSVSAARQLKEGMQNPTTLKGVLTTIFFSSGKDGRKPSTGLRVLRDDANESRRKLVRQLAMPGSLRDQEAAEYGLWKLESDDARAIGAKPPPMPKLTLPVSELETTPYQRQKQQAAPGSPAASAPATPPAAPPAVNIRSRLRPLGK
jgi:hypothetical protein